MRKAKILALLLVLGICLFSATCFSQDKVDKEVIARWHINYASYLIDVGKYMQALESYETAIELTSIRKTRLDALLGKAMLLYTFLDAPDEAIKVYRYIRANFTEARELAYFREGFLLYTLNRTKEAKAVLKEYLKRYPLGRFRFQAEAILKMIERIIKKPVPVPKPPIKIIRPRVRVRICRAARGLQLNSYKGSAVCVKGIGCADSIRIRLKHGAIILNNRKISEKSILLESDKPIEVCCRKKRKRLRGRIVVKQKRDGLLVINLVDIEDYLLSVVPSESYSTWPIEALKAQAVCARTYAYYQYLHRKDREYDLVDDEGDQAYKGVSTETKRTTKAVRETEGLILSYNNRPILAMYTANSGGTTADAGAVFNLYKAYLIAKSDPASLKGKMARWERSFTARQIQNALLRIGLRVNGIMNIRPAQRGPSGRIIKVHIISKNGTYIFRTRTTLKRALRLPEILFTIEKKGPLFIFKGRGWGHGVGYSQWGSAYLGKTKGFKEILGFYYPKTYIKRMW